MKASAYLGVYEKVVGVKPLGEIDAAKTRRRCD